MSYASVSSRLPALPAAGETLFLFPSLQVTGSRQSAAFSKSGCLNLLISLGVLGQPSSFGAPRLVGQGVCT